MLNAIYAFLDWWKHLGYMRPRPHHDPRWRVWGIRPWRGAPFLMFVVDRSETAREVQSEEHNVVP